jgi:mannose/fructose-specific phosphotransferase system component IIA
MIGVIVVTHGQLANELVNAARTMVGELPQFLEANRVEIITGVNLPMLIKLADLQSSSDLLAVAREMREIGRNAIWVASDLLHAEAKT